MTTRTTLIRTRSVSVIESDVPPEMTLIQYRKHRCSGESRGQKKRLAILGRFRR
jgi:hypothetical protein